MYLVSGRLCESVALSLDWHDRLDQLDLDLDGLDWHPPNRLSHSVSLTPFSRHSETDRCQPSQPSLNSLRLPVRLSHQPHSANRSMRVTVIAK